MGIYVHCGHHMHDQIQQWTTLDIDRKKLRNLRCSSRHEDGLGDSLPRSLLLRHMINISLKYLQEGGSSGEVLAEAGIIRRLKIDSSPSVKCTVFIGALPCDRPCCYALCAPLEVCSSPPHAFIFFSFLSSLLFPPSLPFLS